MMLFNWLYSVFVCVLMLNIIAASITFFKKIQKSTASEEKPISTWQDTIEQVLILIASLVIAMIPIFLLSKVNDRWLAIIYTIIMIHPYLAHINDIFSNVKIIGGIIKNDNSGNLNRKEHIAILSLALLVSALHRFVPFDKVQSYANTCLNPWITDWIMISFYVGSISSFIFFICSLIVSPLQLMLKGVKRIPVSSVLQYIKKNETKVKLKLLGQMPTKTLIIPILEYSRGRHIVFRLLLWAVSIIAAMIDVVRIVICIGGTLLGLLVWYIYVFIKRVIKVLIKMALWVLALSDKNIIAISFRVAIILGLGLTVVANMYSPFLYTHEASASVLEFVSSAIIIPVIFEWILSYKNKMRHKTAN